jgi:transposase-like protein
MARHRSHSVAFKRQVAEEFLAGETLHGLAKRHDICIGLLEIRLGCSLEVDEPTRSTPWRRDYQHRSGRGKSCGT